MAKKSLMKAGRAVVSVTVSMRCCNPTRTLQPAIEAFTDLLPKRRWMMARARMLLDRSGILLLQPRRPRSPERNVERKGIEGEHGIPVILG